MAKLTDNQLQSILKNFTIGSKNHYVADCPLPNCQQQGHFYIQRDTQLWDCKKCKNNGNIRQLLFKINKLELLNSGERIVEFEKPLINKILEFQEDLIVTDEDLILSKTRLPIGFKRVYDDEYLNGRDFKNDDYILYPVGVTRLQSKLIDFIIIPVYEEDEVYGYLSRSKKSKKEINNINQKYKDIGSKKRFLRWKNSTTDFGKLLYGFDEVVEGVTHTVILVEGFFAKKKIDEKRNLHDSDLIKCNATFGKGVSKYQIFKLLKKGVKKIILLFDDDAVNEIKKFSFDLELYFEVLIGVLFEGQDIDDMNDDQINEIFEKLLLPFEYFNDVVLKKIKIND